MITMKKRITIRVGDVFCAEIDGQHKCYFQYITNDISQLNSQVIRVFRKHYALNYTPVIEDIVSDDIMFYAHTYIRAGYQNDAWYKIGHSKNLGETDNIFFRLFGDKWYTWKCNKPYQYHEELPEECEKYDLGWMYSYISIMRKIRCDNKEKEFSGKYEH